MEIAKDFTLPGTQGDFTLSLALKQQPVLLIFYPKDNTAG
jgi:peroxiredoxin